MRLLRSSLAVWQVQVYSFLAKVLLYLCLQTLPVCFVLDVALSLCAGHTAWLHGAQQCPDEALNVHLCLKHARMTAALTRRRSLCES